MILPLAAYFCLVNALYLAMVAASRAFYRRDAGAGEISPFAVIKPMKGAEENLEGNLRSLLEADREGRLQIIFAVESADDPAAAAASKVVAGASGADAALVITGPSLDRMGKIHNMIEALPSARHDGMNSGRMTRMIVDASRTHPSSSRMTLTRSRNRSGERSSPCSAAAMVLGTFSDATT